MAIRFEEAMRGRRRRLEFGRSIMRVSYKAYASAGEDEDAVEAAALAYFQSSTYGSRYFTGLELDEQLDQAAWSLTVDYEGRGAWYDETDALSGFEFTTLGGTRHITAPIALRSSYGEKASSEMAGVIGFDGRDVQGCDVPERVFNFSINRRISPAWVTVGYVELLEQLTGCINMHAFASRQEYSVLFLGATGQRRGNEAWNLTWQFSSKRNRLVANGNPITIPGLVDSGTGQPYEIDKYGWDYLWVQYETVEDTVKYTLARKPIAAYVQQVIEAADFGLLGL